MMGTKTKPRGWIDWKAVRDSISLAEVATHLLGPAPGRRGERGRRLWWNCPFHEDRNPSFCVDPGSPMWRCFGCDAHGDAPALVMRIKGMSFPEAVDDLMGGSVNAPSCRSPRPPRRGSPSPTTSTTASSRPEPPAEGLSGEAAAALVANAERRLRTPDGAAALDDLRGRDLTDATIRAARLGVISPLDLPGRPRGIVVPWFDGDRVTLVKIRQPEGRRPKYREVYRDRDRPPAIYPGHHIIRAARPLVIVEGEFDALLLGQELAGMAAVVALGSASARPDARALGPMLAASPWFVATDADVAGDEAASGWPAPARRVRPPEPCKDWTEAKQDGVDLRSWWAAVLDGDAPPRRTVAWADLAAQRWGPGIGDETPGIIIDRPDQDRRRAALQAAVDDPYAIAERRAIQAESEDPLLAEAQSKL